MITDSLAASAQSIIIALLAMLVITVALGLVHPDAARRAEARVVLALLLSWRLR